MQVRNWKQESHSLQSIPIMADTNRKHHPLRRVGAPRSIASFHSITRIPTTRQLIQYTKTPTFPPSPSPSPLHPLRLHHNTPYTQNTHHPLPSNPSKPNPSSSSFTIHPITTTLSTTSTHRTSKAICILFPIKPLPDRPQTATLSARNL